MLGKTGIVYIATNKDTMRGVSIASTVGTTKSTCGRASICQYCILDETRVYS
jgi:hypothetical protein